MKITATETELLELLDKSDSWQERYFQDNGMMEIRKDTVEAGEGYFESLPDLAERLWKLAVEKCSFKELRDSIYDVYRYRKQHENVGHFVWFGVYAISIDRIVAALLALKRSGIEC